MSSANMARVAIFSTLLVGLVVAQDNLVQVMAPAGEIHGSFGKTQFDGKEYSYTAFVGIPYAMSTAGEMRFKKPEPRPPFTTPYKALEFGPACPQYITADPSLKRDEDCLNLNVIVPGNASEAMGWPVMIYIYGGSFQFGWGDPYVWPAFAATNNVILVTFNYRVGAFGFLSNNEDLRGNYGLWDQHMAITWVNKNIGKFGGDPSRVTLFGQSAGAASVIYQAMYPGNRGYFKNVIAQSGNALVPWGLDSHPRYMYDKYVKKLDCAKHMYQDDILKCLRDKHFEESFKLNITDNYFIPSVDHEFVMMSPQEVLEGKMSAAWKIMDFFSSLNVVLGLNNYDGIEWSGDKYKLENGLFKEEFAERLKSSTAPVLMLNSKLWDLFQTTVAHQYVDWESSDIWNPFALRQGIADIRTDYYYLASMVHVAMTHAQWAGQGKVFMYQFEHKPSVSPTADWIKGAVHSDELPFVFGMPWTLVSHVAGRIIYFTDPGTVVPAKEMQLSKDMMSLWTQIAYNGQPTDKTEWPEYTTYGQDYIVFNGSGKPYPVQKRMRPQFVNFWNNVVHEIKKASDNYGCSSGGWPPVSAGARSVASARSIAFAVSMLVLFRNVF